MEGDRESEPLTYCLRPEFRTLTLQARLADGEAAQAETVGEIEARVRGVLHALAHPGVRAVVEFTRTDGHICVMCSMVATEIEVHTVAEGLRADLAASDGIDPTIDALSYHLSTPEGMRFEKNNSRVERMPVKV